VSKYSEYGLMSSGHPKSQFARFLEAARKRGRSRLRQTFMARFKAIVCAPGSSSGIHQSATASNGYVLPQILPASKIVGYSASGSCGDLAFSCSACGSPSVALPDVFDDESEVRCGACNRRLMTWKEFKAICEQRANELKINNVIGGADR
jgi:hypothetical protein